MPKKVEEGIVEHMQYDINVWNTVTSSLSRCEGRGMGQFRDKGGIAKVRVYEETLWNTTSPQGNQIYILKTSLNRRTPHGWAMLLLEDTDY